jgi:hypothetical protein
MMFIMSGLALTVALKDIARRGVYCTYTGIAAGLLKNGQGMELNDDEA